MGTHRQYARSFKERAVNMSYERDNIQTLASELGITAEQIYKWRREFAEHGESSFQGHGVERLSDEGRQLKEVQKKLRNAEMEFEVLKKAIAVLHHFCRPSAKRKQVCFCALS